MSMPSERPAIIGCGRTAFGEHFEREPDELLEEAGLKALETANLERRDIQAVFISDYFIALTNKVGIEEGFVSEFLELNVPMEKLRSFSSAFSAACRAIEAGHCSVALVCGVEKMCDRLDKIRDDLMMLVDPWTYYAGGTPESSYELLLRAYAKAYGLSKEDEEKLLVALAHISAKNHRLAINNPLAQFRKQVAVDTVVRARAGKLLGLYDFAPVSDGASAVILASRSFAEGHSGEAVLVAGEGSASDFISYSMRPFKAGFKAAEIAVNSALKEAGISVKDIGLAELYDFSTVTELVLLEDAGFCRRGEAWRVAYESLSSGDLHYNLGDGDLFVNTNGGLKADGNPLGATGGAQIIEVVEQLLGKAGARQVDLGGREYGLAVELEGFGTKAYAHVLKAVG